jgi:hypothetical protein
MRRILWISSVMLVLAPLAVSAGQQSDKTPPPDNPPTIPAVVKPAPQQSLADAARKAREKKGADAAKPKVWDNDNIPVTESTRPAPNSSTDATATATTDDNAAASPQEKEWRERFATARAKLKRDQDSLVLQQKDFGRLSVQYYPDPQKGLTQSYSQSDLIKARQKIDVAKDQVVTDQKAIDDLEEELRKSGGDEGWSRL